MKLKRIKIRNFKKIEELDMPCDGNIIYVKGGNEKGKSTFTDAIISLLKAKVDVDNPITTGKDNGSLEGIFENAKEEVYTVKIDLEEGTAKIKFVYPDGKISRKVTDIRDLFNYNSFSPEEFVAKSKTAEGRKWQRDQVLNLLPEEDQETFRKAMEQEKISFDARREAKREADIYRKVIKAEAPSDTEAEMSQNTEVLKQEHEKASEDYKELYEKFRKVDELNKKLNRAAESYSTRRSSIESQINDIDAQIKALEDSKDKKHVELENLKGGYLGYKEQINELLEGHEKVDEDKIEAARQTISLRLNEYQQAQNASDNVMKFEGKKKALEELMNKVSEHQQKLDEARDLKQGIVESSNLPVKGLQITSEGLLIDDLPFNENQISTSRIMEVALTLLMEMNKATPIVILGRAESFDKENLNKIIEESRKRQCQLFIDKVDTGELAFEIEEQLQEVTANPVQRIEKYHGEPSEIAPDKKARIIPDFSKYLNKNEDVLDKGNDASKTDDFTDFQF